MIIKRHNLLEITNMGRNKIFQQLKAFKQQYDFDLIRELIVEGYDGIKVPGIIRREENTIIKGTIPVGFSSPFRYQDNRLRIPGFVPKEEIVKAVSPYEVIKKEFVFRTKCLQALKEIVQLADEFKICLGVWGSSGLEIYSGLPYTDDNSDLDLLINPCEYGKLKEFYSDLKKIGEEYKCGIDPELNLPNGYGVKVAELFMNTEDILGKSINDVKLIPKKSIICMLKN